MALDLTALDGPLDFQIAPGRQSTLPPRASLDRFVEDPDQPRTEFDGPEWDDFCADVEERGILQPIVVKPLGDKLLIRFGARRYRAAVRNGFADAPYVSTDDERQLDDYSQVAENEQRQALQPLELAQFIEKKVRAGEKKRRIAERLRIDPSAVTHLLALADAPPSFLLELYHSRRCRQPHLLYELRRLYSCDATQVEAACTSAVDVDRGFVRRLAEMLATQDANKGSEPAPSDAIASNDAPASSGGEPPENPPQSESPSASVGPSRRRSKIAKLCGTLDGKSLALRLDLVPSAGMIYAEFVGESKPVEVAIDRIVLRSFGIGHLD